MHDCSTYTIADVASHGLTVALILCFSFIFLFVCSMPEPNATNNGGMRRFDPIYSEQNRKDFDIRDKITVACTEKFVRGQKSRSRFRPNRTWIDFAECKAARTQGKCVE